jgi:pimeloyl-ACP methyl ester carboxylesterase
MQAELISVETDTIPLDGLFYRPGGEARGGVMLMHGNTMNFYVGAPRFLPPELVARGYACLACNRRGHDVLSTFASRELVGGAFQTVAEAIDDNERAGRFFARAGFGAPAVIGHSHGGMLAAYHAAHHPEIPALVLLSAHRGGPELMAGASPNFSQGSHEEFLEKARLKVEAGAGRELMLLPGWYHAISAATYLDASACMPSLVDQAEKITCPVLFVRGDGEPAENYPAERFAEACKGPCEVVILPDCDHFYGGHESLMAVMIADFLDRHMP